MLELTETEAAPAAPDMSVVGTKLLDRYVLPKVAMVLILISTAAGAWLSLRGIASLQPTLVFAKWAYFLSTSVVLGGSLWGAFYARGYYPEQDIQAPSRFLHFEFAGYATMQRYAAMAMLIAGSYLLAGYLALFEGLVGTWYGALAVLQVLLWVGTVAVVSIGGFKLNVQGEEWLTRAQSWLRLTITLSVASLLVTGLLDVLPFWGLDHLAIGARWVHLVAFGVWFGGAIWNVFVAVPAARKSLSFETVFAAASQLEEFRKVVRVALPLVLATGLFQAFKLTDFNLALLIGSPFGVLVLLKLALIFSLVGIFIACPMWRACSPIAGVCDITDIDPTPECSLKSSNQAPELAAR